MDDDEDATGLEFICSPSKDFETDPLELARIEADIVYETEIIEVEEDAHGLAADSYSWTDANVKMLLDAVGELRPKIGTSPKLSNKSKMWREITRRFQESGYSHTQKQIMNKYTSLERQYKRTRIQKQSGRKTKTYSYQSEMDRVLLNGLTGLANEPEHLVTAEDGIDDLSSSTADSGMNESQGQSKSTTTKKALSFINKRGLVADELKKLRELKAEESRLVRDMKLTYHREKLEYLQRKKQILARKEAYMARKEALLEATLKKLENKS